MLALQNCEVVSMKGGSIDKAEDSISFLERLPEGILFKPETLALVQAWVKDSNEASHYGMGSGAFHKCLPRRHWP